MTVAEWLAYAKSDAEKRGLKDVIPALEMLAKATEQLRRADWNEGPLSPSPKAHDYDDK
jgi:hypothetical protein